MDANLGTVAVVGIVAISLATIFIFAVHHGKDVEASAEEGDKKFSLGTKGKAIRKRPR
jgi:hypothetical protein